MKSEGQEGTKAGGQEKQDGTLTRSQQLGLWIMLVVLIVYVAYDLIRGR